MFRQESYKENKEIRGVMRTEINGWPIIARYLEIRGLRQCDLARVLGVSPAAVTQIKKGESLLGPSQFDTVIGFCGMADSDILEFYSMVFRARILGEHRSSRALEIRVCPESRSRQERPAECPIEWLLDYQPALESLRSYLIRKTGIRSIGDQIRLEVGNGSLVKGVLPGSTLLIGVERYPIPGDLVLVGLRERQLLLRRYLPRDGSIILGGDRAVGPDYVWEVNLDPGFVLWMRPVQEIVVSFRLPRKESCRNNAK